MPTLRPAVWFILRFGLFYGLLIAPWPGWNRAYGAWFRAFNGSIFGSDGRRYVHFEATQRFRPPLDTQITLANRDQVDARGHVQGKVLGLDSRGVGWVPTAFFAALTLASPVGWRRRAWALFWGLILVHAFILASVGCYLWNQSADMGLATLTPFWKAVADGFEETFVTQLGASFVAPALIWLVVTFRIQDLTDVLAVREPRRPQR